MDRWPPGARGGHPVTIRRIRHDEGGLLREARLRAVRDVPEAFGQTLEGLLVETDAAWRAAARASAAGDSRAWFLAEREGGVVGLVQGRRRPPATLLVFSMWVAPEARRSGIGRALIDETERWAGGWGGLETILWVVVGNDGALRFYERLGFRLVTVGPDARSGVDHRSHALRRPIPYRPAPR
jgi:GNAT superfamily N-acetyltransferase